MKRIIFAIVIASAGSPSQLPQTSSPTTTEFTLDQLNAFTPEDGCLGWNSLANYKAYYDIIASLEVSGENPELLRALQESPAKALKFIAKHLGTIPYITQPEPCSFPDFLKNYLEHFWGVNLEKPIYPKDFQKFLRLITKFPIDISKDELNADTDILTREEFERAMKLTKILMQGTMHKDIIYHKTNLNVYDCDKIRYNLNLAVAHGLSAFKKNPKSALHSLRITDEDHQRLLRLIK